MCCENLSNCQFYQSKIDAESGMGKLYKKDIVSEIKTSVPAI